MSLTKVDITMISMSAKVVEDFGAIGDGVTDDSAALQAAFTWSAENKQVIFLQGKRYYTSTTLNCNGAIIRSIGGTPGFADPYYLSNSQGEYYYTTPNSSYYMNYAPGVSLTWQQFIQYSAYGACIVSDYDGDILQITGLNSFDIDGIAVIGDHRKTSQCGIASATDDTTQTAFQNIKNCNIVGCGAAGINFRMGLQEGTLDTVNCIFNNGVGMNVTHNPSVQCAVDANRITNCSFQFNRLYGLFFSYVTKHLYITKCDFSGNGQYENGQQPGGGYIDPLLGYNRTPPSNVALMAAGIWFNDSDPANGGFSFNVNIEDCEGELMAVGVHVRAQSGLGAYQFMRIQNCSFYRDPLFPYSGGNNGSMFFFDVIRLNNSLFSQNYNQALDYIDFSSGIPPAISSTNNSNLFLDSNVTSGNTSAQVLASFLQYQMPHAFGTVGYTVAGLPTQSLLTVGTRAYVTDSSVITFGSALVGGGNNIVPVFYNGTSWVVG